MISENIEIPKSKTTKKNPGKVCKLFLKCIEQVTKRICISCSGYQIIMLCIDRGPSEMSAKVTINVILLYDSVTLSQRLMTTENEFRGIIVPASVQQGRFQGSRAT